MLQNDKGPQTRGLPKDRTRARGTKSSKRAADVAAEAALDHWDTLSEARTTRRTAVFRLRDTPGGWYVICIDLRPWPSVF